MPIVKHRTEPDAAAAFIRQLPDFVGSAIDDRSKTSVREAYAGETPAAPALTDLLPSGERIVPQSGQPVFVLSLEAAANNAGVSGFTPAGYRFFAGTEPGKILMGKVAQRTCPAGWRMTAGHYGTRVSDAYKASNALDHLPEVQARNYELRILTVPGLSLEAFWLVAHGSNPVDLVVPFPAMPNQPIEALNREPVYTMPNFLATIRPLAQLRLIGEAAARCGSDT